MARDYILDLTKIRGRGDKRYNLEQWIVRFVKKQPVLNGEKCFCVLRPAEKEDDPNEIHMWDKIDIVKLFRYFVFHEVRHLVKQYVKDERMKDDEEITELYEEVQWEAFCFFWDILLKEGEE